MEKYLETLPGKSYPLGATLTEEGVNFALFTKNSEAVELLLFDDTDHSIPTHTIRLDPVVNKTFYYWHVFIPGLKPGQLYGYRVYGPFEPELGNRFDGSKVLVDPYAKAVVTDTYDREQAKMFGVDNCARAIKSVIIDTKGYDWEGDKPLNLPFEKSIIYELHVGGFTKSPSSGLADELRGTYRGLIEKIPYLKSLGITAVELMPVQQFDPFDLPNPELTNYWGYSPIAYFAPHNGYGHTKDPMGLVNEFRDMVKALHKAGMEVILDVVFNHTAEGNDKGPTFSFKGLQNRAYYILDKNNKFFYKNFSGTGNTLKTYHSVVRRLMRDCLRYWVSEMHIDGFRFDLAAIMTRDEEGNPLSEAPILWSIESDPVLAPAKIIAEAWDVEQYRLGTFTGHKWAEWNGKYRDDVRRFIKGDAGMAPAFADKVGGSAELFGEIIRDPNRSINFITCHDGFTLNDLVSYDVKHNEANGEENRDGNPANFSWNCGVEGPSDDPGVESLRARQIKNFLTILMLSQGTPMLSMGDEVRRTQLGNNNAYCQDNPTSWFDWEKVEKEEDLLRFVKKLIRFNLSFKYFQENSSWVAPEPVNTTQFEVHGVRPGELNWRHDSHALAFSLHNLSYPTCLYIMVNTYWKPLTFELPREDGNLWYRVIDTAAAPPHDFCEIFEAPIVENFRYEVQEHSVVVVQAKVKSLKMPKGISIGRLY